MSNDFKPLRMGWQCPRCATCFSPDVLTCTKCQPAFIPYHVPVPAFPSTTPYTITSSSDAPMYWNGKQFLVEKEPK